MIKEIPMASKGLNEVCAQPIIMILGSSECKTCSNVYLASIDIFILKGVAFVALVTLLNMTASVEL